MTFLLSRRVAMTALALIVLPLAAQGAEPHRGGTLTMGVESNLPGFDPLIMRAFADRTVGLSFYEALMRIDERGRIQPHLAKSLTTEDGGKTYVATLREDVTFHDGTPFNADAVVFNFRRMIDPENGCRCAASVEPVESVEKLGPYRVAFHLRSPNASFPAVLADIPGLQPSPTAIRDAEKTDDGYGDHPVGTGPFQFKSWQRGVSVTTTRNPNYWRQGLPYLDKVVYRPIPDQQTRLATLRSDGIQLMMTPAPQDVLAAKKDRLPVKVIEMPGFGTTFVMFETQSAPLDDARVRRALAYATNRPLILKSVGRGMYPGTDSPFGKGMPEGRFQVDFPQYDPDKARALLEDYGKPVSFKLSVLAVPQSVLFAQVLQQMWSKVGVEVELEQLEGLRLISQASGNDFQAMLYRWAGQPDPDQNVYQFFHSQSPRNYTRFSNPQMDRLLEKGRTSADEAERTRAYRGVAELLAKEVPYLFLMSGKNYLLAGRGVHGVPSVPDGLARLDSAWLEQ